MLICLNHHESRVCGTENIEEARFCRNCGKKLLNFSLQLHNLGTQIDDRYQIIHMIGWGGFGAVYEAEVVQIPSTHVALKETLDPDMIYAFKREFEVLRGLEHLNLPKYHEVFEYDGNGYLVMEFVPGQSLKDILEKQKGPVLEKLVLIYADQLCDVLAYLHSQNILHKDIKPANVRLTPEGLIKLVDFGLVKDILSGPTRNSARAISLPYSSHEQWSGGTDQRSDIYSLGATLYHLLTNHEPPGATQRLTVSPDPLHSPRDYNPHVSAHVSQAIMTAMRFRREERFPSATEFKQALLATPQATFTRSLAPKPQKYLKGATLRQTLGHLTGSVGIVAFDPDGSLEKCVTIWTATNPTLVTRSLYADELTLISICRDGTMQLWRALDGQRLREWNVKDFLSDIRSMDMSPDGQTLASVGSEGFLRLWRAETSSLLRKWKAGSGWFMNNKVNNVAFGPDGLSLATANQNHTVRLWKVEDGSLIREWKSSWVPIHQVTNVKFSPDGQVLASASTDGTAKLWWVRDGSLMHTLKGHNGYVFSVAWSPDGEAVATAGSDWTVRLWRVRDGSLISTLNEHTDNVLTVAWSPDGQTIASGSSDKTIKLWQVEYD